MDLTVAWSSCQKGPLCNDSPVQPTDAVEIVRAAAVRFLAHHIDVAPLWEALHSNLNDLCVDGPLHDDFLALFNALESWEVSVGADRDRAREALLPIARRLAHST